MWEAIWQSGPFIIGVAAAFALFMGALFLMERRTAPKRGRRGQAAQKRPAPRVIRCERQDAA